MSGAVSRKLGHSARTAAWMMTALAALGACDSRSASATGVTSDTSVSAIAKLDLPGTPVEFAPFTVPGDARITAEQHDGRVDISISSEHIPEFSYSIYGVTDIKPSGRYCMLRYEVVGSASKVAVLDKDSKEVAIRPSSGLQAAAELPFVATPGEGYRLIFYKPERTGVPVIYKNVEARCLAAATLKEAATQHPSYRLLGIDSFAQSRLNAALVVSAGAVGELHDRLNTVGKVVREKSIDADNGYNLANYLISEFRAARPLLRQAYPELREDHQWPFFVVNVAHFTVPLTRQAEETPRNIIRSGGGTCWQQTQVGVYLYNLVGNSSHAEIASSDPVALGHAFFAGPDFVADVTNNIFLPLSAKEWNALRPPGRLDFLHTKAIYGISLDVWGGKGRDESLTIVSQAELETGYFETVQRLPFAKLMDPRTIPFEDSSTL